MNSKTYLLCLAFCGSVLLGNARGSDESPIPTGKKKADFDLSQYKGFIDFQLSRPKPECRMAEMGIPGRRVEGQLVDHDGNPMEDVAVAIVEPIGYSGHCYYDNFDTTDAQGRFVVDGSVAKNRLVFHKSNGRTWKVTLDPKQEQIQFSWPQAAKVTVRVPKEIATQSVRIQTKRYWAAMSVQRHAAELDENGSAVIEVIPGEYYVTAEKTIKVGGTEKTLAIEIARFVTAEGEKKVVDCGEGDATVIHGKYTVEPNPILGNLKTYVLIERDRLSYEDQPPIADLLQLDANGTFRSRPLSPGSYSVKLMAKALVVGGRFGRGGDSVLKTWRVKADESVPSIDLESIPKPDPVAQQVESVLQQAAGETGSSRGGGSADRLKQSDERDKAEKELLRLLSDPLSPHPMRRVVPNILRGMTDSPQVIMGLLKTLENPISERERGTAIGALQTSTQIVDEIVAAIESYVDDPNHITRGITMRTLGDLGVNNPQHTTKIVKLLERGLGDSWEATRLTAADYLGRIGSANALPALLKTRNDVYGPVAVAAAYSAWKITGDPDDVYPTMAVVLERDGIAGLWEAAYFMKSVAKSHPVPESTQGILRTVAAMAGKPPFKSSFEYQQSRAAKAAQQVLDQIADSGRP